jgi:hypothetical protein
MNGSPKWQLNMTEGAFLNINIYPKLELFCNLACAKEAQTSITASAKGYT